MGIGELLTVFGSAALGLVVFIFVIITTYKNLYTKVGPNEALVISGGLGEWVTNEQGERHRLGFRIVKGGGTLINPLTEKAGRLTLEVIKVEIVAELRTRDGAPINVDTVAQVKVRGDDISIRIAAEHFLSDSEGKIRSVASDVISVLLRSTLNAMTLDAIYAERDSIARRVAEIAGGDLGKMGLEIISLNVREISARGEAVATVGLAQVVQ